MLFAAVLIPIPSLPIYIEKSYFFSKIKSSTDFNEYLFFILDQVEHGPLCALVEIHTSSLRLKLKCNYWTSLCEI